IWIIQCCVLPLCLHFGSIFPGLQYTLLAFLPYYCCFSHYFPVLIPVLILICFIQCCVLPL
ncbi:uncharacterized protein B0H18DRAFT_1043445, partial [Fomitopsis serialis]|uniref:uncharacterized protein n=1 Tax=Fomitopsis serialis TaxID=139415 RepID=UPI002007250B